MISFLNAMTLRGKKIPNSSMKYILFPTYMVL